MSTPDLPPKKDYELKIDPRFLTSASISDEVYRVFALLEHHVEKRDKRRSASISSEAVSEILGRPQVEVENFLDALAGLGVLSIIGREDWSNIGDPIRGRRELADALGFEVGPISKAKLDTRVFFAPEVGDRAARLWAAASIGQTDELKERQGWTPDELRLAADELVKLGIAACLISKDAFVVITSQLDNSGLRIVEFTCDELGKGQMSVTLDSEQSKKTAASSREACLRRARSRRDS